MPAVDETLRAASPGLSDLRDIHLPDAVGLWPPAPGWWIVAALLLAVALLAWLARRRRVRSVGRQALRELAVLERDFLRQGGLDELAAGLSILMRRVALLRFGVRETALLHGQHWIDFLGGKAAFDPRRRECLASLERAVYAGADPELERDAGSDWIAVTRDWIERTT